MYVHALATLDFSILLPMVLGLAAGAVGISFGMSFLFRRFYTFTYSVIFGIILTMIPNMLNESCFLQWNLASVVCVVVLVLGFGVSYFLGDVEKNKRKLTKLFRKKKHT